MLFSLTYIINIYYEYVHVFLMFWCFHFVMCQIIILLHFVFSVYFPSYSSSVAMGNTFYWNIKEWMNVQSFHYKLARWEWYKYKSNNHHYYYYYYLKVCQPWWHCGAVGSTRHTKPHGSFRGTQYIFLNAISCELLNIFF